MPRNNNLLHVLLILSLITYQGSSQREPAPPRPVPDQTNGPAFARWLVSQGSWGVLNTLGPKGKPFGNVASYSDGGKGTPYFYLSISLDPTGFYALKNSTSSFTVSEYSLESFDHKIDPQSPTCSKVTLSGQLIMLVDRNEAKFAEDTLFSKHVTLGGWPKSQGSFRSFGLMIEEIFLVNNYSPAISVDVKQYFKA